MPWKEQTVENSREEFVRRVLAREASKSALCREYGISRPTGDKWLKRYQEGGGLSDRSRRPFHTPNKIPPEDEARIVAARIAEPAVGAMKTRRMLRDEGWEEPPSVSTINAVFRRNGLITKQASAQATPYVRFQKDAPNIMWQADFKGDYALGDRQRCYPLSILDDYSRFCLCGDAKPNMQLPGTIESFKNTFLQYGLPDTLLCDNGVPWGCSQSTSITAFEVWLMELGILTMHIRPKHPQCQGKVERFNGSFKKERLQFYTPKNLADAQRQREEYREFYNEKRPHHALDLDTPASRYTPSSRSMPEKIEAWEYESGCDIRKVKQSGYITYAGHGFYLSEGLKGKEIALLPSETDGILDILFRQFRVARLSLHENTIISRRIYLLHDDPRVIHKV